MKATNWKSVVVFALLGMVVIHAAALWQMHNEIFSGYGDFSAFYTEGKIARQGEGRRLYERPLQWDEQQEFASTVKIRRGPLPYIHPPFEALIFLPLAFFSYQVAFVTWMCIKILILAFIPFLLIPCM